MSVVEGVDTAPIHVESHRRVFSRKQASQRQADVTQTDYADFDIFSHLLGY